MNVESSSSKSSSSSGSSGSSNSSTIKKSDDGGSSSSSKKAPSISFNKDTASFTPTNTKKKSSVDLSGGGDAKPYAVNHAMSQGAQGAAPVGQSQGTQPVEPMTVGYHAKPDALTAGDAAAQQETMKTELQTAKDLGSKSVTVVVNQNTDPAVFRATLDAAAGQGMQVNVRVNCGEWKPTIPAKWDQDSHTYQYDPAAAENYKKTMDKLFGTNFGNASPPPAPLTGDQLKGLGAVQLGNEPLDPKEWDNFVGKSWDGRPDHEEYKEWLQNEAPDLKMTPQQLSDQIARSMGLATRDMLEDMGPELARVLGGPEKIATTPMGAGFADYNNVAAQKEFYLGMMGMGLDGKVTGHSGLELAGQVGSHAYMDNAATPEQLQAYSSTTGYGEALRIYRDATGIDAPGSATARPVFTEVGLDKNFPGGQGKQLTDVFIGQFVNDWNDKHPGAPVADISIWGGFPGYDFEGQWLVTPEARPGLGESIKASNPKD
ncbi:MAG TPA: hypothetical protein VFB81_22855 [Myxococcales bacterium]|nr:hypothetical protein [Myxococcales bacterium]